MYLKEIQGFRVVAALLVAIYHIWFHRVSGGVDAFFVIAGFFLFQGFLKRDDLHFGDVTKYWRRTLGRIVPSASAVVLGTSLLFSGFGTRILSEERIDSAIAGILFYENMWLSNHGVNYLSMGQTPSPFQQLWALSVQFQLYFMLPPLVYLVFRLCRNRTNARRAMTQVFLGLLALAFAYALYKTYRYQPSAYFNTFARLWEFLAGGLLALVLPRIVVGRAVAKGLGYASLITLVGFAAVIPVADSFPGWAALIPVLATSAIIVAARNNAGMVVLNNRAMQWLGNLSFTFYLWHWPIYLFIWDRTGTPNVSVGVGMAILLVAFVLAFVTYHFLETPFRNLRLVKKRLATAVTVCALALVPTLGFSWGWKHHVDERQVASLEDIEKAVTGEKVAQLTPDLRLIKDDIPSSYKDGCYQRNFRASDVVSCNYGNPSGSYRIALVGGSHALQWLPALQEIARKDPRIKIINLVKSGCTFTLSLDGMEIDSDRAACLDWNRQAVEKLKALDPDMVVTNATRIQRDGETIPQGYRMAWDALPHTPVIAIRDNPRASFDIAACIDRNGEDDPACDAMRPTLARDALQPENLPDHVEAVDFSGFFCEKGRCPAVRDKIMLYRDSNHITATASRLMAQPLYDRIKLHLD
ncbi:acyltransferase family protein [Thioclava sp. GXIMD4216]|uniref:acyltransferase family protein n=1 Tax=Thioclava sp. GXIMD4216 TaxID=3131929 RepID=UPI0030CDD8CC